MAFDDPVAENPVWLHLQVDLDWGPGPRPKAWADGLPDIQAKDIRRFNGWVADVGRDAPGLGVVYAAFSLKKAVETGRAAKVVGECADLLVRLFLSQDRSQGIQFTLGLPTALRRSMTSLRG